MARGESKDLLTRLADAGEEAIHRLADAPGADRFFGAISSMRDRVDELQRRVRGLEGIDKRVADLEQRLEKLEGGAKSGTTRGRGSTPAKRTTTTRARKTTTTSASSTAKGATSRRGSGSASTRKSP